MFSRRYPTSGLPKSQSKIAELDFDSYERLKNKQLEKAYKRGQHACLSLCAKFHAALPRELRDMVYDQLVLQGSRQYVLDGKNYSNNPLVQVSFFAPRSQMPKPPSGRRDTWCYSEYTGAIIAREIAERWYHNGVFVLDAGDRLIGKFLATDVWERDVVPASAVRHLRIDIFPAYSTGNRADDEERASQVQSSLAQLRSLSNRNTQITFNITSQGGGMQGFRALDQAMRNLKNIVAFLRAEKGFRKVEVRQTVCPAVPPNVTAYCDDPTKMYLDYVK